MLEPELMKWIYSKNPYNYSDISDYVKNIRKHTTKEELKSALKILSEKNVVEFQDRNFKPDDIPEDLGQMGKTMCRLCDIGRRDVENWRFHQETKTIASNANRLTGLTILFIAMSAGISFLQFLKCDSKQPQVIQQVTIPQPSQQKAPDSLIQKTKNLNSFPQKKLSNQSKK